MLCFSGPRGRAAARTALCRFTVWVLSWRAVTPLAPVFQGTLTDEDEGDTYAFAFAAGPRVEMVFSMGALSAAEVHLYDPLGSEVPMFVAFASQDVWHFRPAMAGTYTLTVQRAFAGGHYTVAWGQAPASDPVPFA